MEGAGLGCFMLSACLFTAFFEYPGSPVRQTLENPFVWRALTGRGKPKWHKAGDKGPEVEFLEYLSPGRPYPADEKANDLIHWQTRFSGIGLEKAERISPSKSRVHFERDCRRSKFRAGIS
jgi:hypothetical protein